MKQIPLNPETEAIARRLIWFEEPAKALEDPIRFMAYAMKGPRDDMTTLRSRYVSDDDFREALDNAPPGIIPPSAWAYWNAVMGRDPAPPLPKRTFGEEGSTAEWSFPGDFGGGTGTAEPAPSKDGEGPDRLRRVAEDAIVEIGKRLRKP